MPIQVKPVEDFREQDAPAAYYFQGTTDGTRAAAFYINTFEPSSRPKHTLPALAFHEGVPGHHLQIAIARKTQDLPAFRRLSAGVVVQRVRRGLGALYRAPGRRAGPVPGRPRTLRHARLPGLASVSPGGGHRPATTCAGRASKPSSFSSTTSA